MHKIYIQQSLQNIMDYNCKILDIRERFGNTGYIDFIKQSEVTENIMKGIDDNERPFIVFKAEFVYNTNNTNTNNKNTKIIKKTFTTFFQRYTGEDHFFVSCQTGFENYNSCITANFNNFDKELDNEYNILFKLLNEGSTIETFDNIKYEISLSQL
jgi:hypothetical protein